MIYLDNGATTFPKPRIVLSAVNRAMANGANPGRGGHALAMMSGETIYNARKTTAEFFGARDLSNVIFCINCTTALNFVIKGVLKKGDHVIISNYEHNAVLRPVEKLKSKGIISYSVFDVDEKDGNKTIDNVRNCIKPETKLIVCTYASNVFGIKLPVERICALCHQYGILTCVDAAQAAGIIPIDLSKSSIDYLCVAGHKGLYGPMGTGALIINCDTIPDSLVEGGTGSNSENYNQPDVLPDKFESGTPNYPGIAGMAKGVEFVKAQGITNLYKREMALIQYAYKALAKNKNVIIYTDYPNYETHVPVLSFNIVGKDSETVSEILNNRFSIAVRAGLHCAPLAHKAKNTIDIGTVRVVPSCFTTKNDISSLISAVSFIK